MYGGAYTNRSMLMNVSLAFCGNEKTSYLSHAIASHGHAQGAKIHNSK